MKVLRDLFRDYRFAASFIILCILLAYGALSFFSPIDPASWAPLSRDLPPSAKHLLGTDSRGIDIFGQAPLPCEIL